MWLSPVGKIAYIDVQDGDQSGHIRCSDASSAAAIVHAQLPGCTFQLLAGFTNFILVCLHIQQMRSCVFALTQYTDVISVIVFY